MFAIHIVAVIQIVQRTQIFSFCLPNEINSPNLISCDPNSRISKSRFAEQIQIGEIFCYSLNVDLTEKDDLSNLDFSQYGVSNFQDILPQPKIRPLEPDVNNDQHEYLTDEKIKFNITTSDESDNITLDYLYLPVGIGSFFCNALIPLKIGMDLQFPACFHDSGDNLLEHWMGIKTISQIFLCVKFDCLNTETDPHQNLLNSNHLPSPPDLGIMHFRFMFEQNTILNQSFTWSGESYSFLFTLIWERPETNIPVPNGYQIGMPLLIYDSRERSRFLFGVDQLFLTNDLPSEESFYFANNLFTGQNLNITAQKIPNENEENNTNTIFMKRITFTYALYGTQSKNTYIIVKAIAEEISADFKSIETKWIFLNDDNSGPRQPQLDTFFSLSFGDFFNFLYASVDYFGTTFLIFFAIVFIFSYLILSI